MKKTLCVTLAVFFLLSACIGVLASEISALDAFNSLTGQQVQMNNPDKSNAEYLAEIMAGVYATAPTDTLAATEMAGHLRYLTGITTRDIASFASANQYPVAQVRNAYYMALANALRAEIMINPASEERYRNVQVILSLFLEQDETQVDHASREAIRSSLTPESAAAIAQEYNLPRAFVEFIIMDDDWDDDQWENDDDWREELHWDDDDLYEDSDDTLKLGDRDGAGSTWIADLQERLISLGYLSGKADGVFGEQTQAALIQYQLANGAPATGIFDSDDLDDMLSSDVVARWDYEDSFDDSPDYDNTADNSVNYDNSPAAQNSPDDSPDPTRAPVAQNSPDDSPDPTRAPAAQNSPDDSPDPTRAPAAQNSPDDSPDPTRAPVAQNSPDDSPDPTRAPAAQNSPDDSPDRDNSPDYEDS